MTPFILCALILLGAGAAWRGGYLAGRRAMTHTVTVSRVNGTVVTTPCSCGGNCRVSFTGGRT